MSSFRSGKRTNPNLQAPARTAGDLLAVLSVGDSANEQNLMDTGGLVFYDRLFLINACQFIYLVSMKQ